MRTWLVTVVALAVCSVPYGHTVTAITDVETQPVMMLRTSSNVAQVITPASVAAAPNIDASLKPTGKSRRRSSGPT